MTRSLLFLLAIVSFAVAIWTVALEPSSAQERRNPPRRPCHFEHDAAKHPAELGAPRLAKASDVDAKIVSAICAKLGIRPAIDVYHMKGLDDAVAVKPGEGKWEPMLPKIPKLRGVIVDPDYMNRVQAQDREHGKAARTGVLAHEIAHILLPNNLRELIGRNGKPEKIVQEVPHVHVRKVLANLHKVAKTLHIPREEEEQQMDELAADYLAGAILAYLKVPEEGLENFLEVLGSKGAHGPHDHKHPGGHTRAKVVHMGYVAHDLVD